jgi:hypothetical protein
MSTPPGLTRYICWRERYENREINLHRFVDSSPGFRACCCRRPLVRRRSSTGARARFIYWFGTCPEACLRRAPSVRPPTAGGRIPLRSVQRSSASSARTDSLWLFKQCKRIICESSASWAIKMPRMETDQPAFRKPMGHLLWKMAKSSGGKMGLGRIALQQLT